MNNDEIIIRECIGNGLYTAEDIQQMLANGQEVPVHTLKEWGERGYRVKQGEHARITTRLWRRSKKKDENEAHFYLAKAFLFTINQVVRKEQING